MRSNTVGGCLPSPLPARAPHFAGIIGWEIRRCAIPGGAVTTCGDDTPARRVRRMPRLTVEGARTVEVPRGKRLVNALEDEAAIDQLHACGGNARCTTCRVEF